MLLCKLFALKPVTLNNFMVIHFANFLEKIECYRLVFVLGGWCQRQSTNLGNWSVGYAQEWESEGIK